MIIRYEEVESTNQTAKGSQIGTVVIAKRQTSGYGKYGREFYSPEGGLYMSMVLPLDKTPAVIVMTTAVAVCSAIENICKKTVGIKWVNDIVLNNKKVGGILIETYEQTAIVGIGLNVFTQKFPNDLPHIGSIGVEDVRDALAAEIIDNMAKKENPYNEYKSRMILMGEEVRVREGKDDYEAIIKDLDEQGRLIIEKIDGTETKLVAGEVCSVTL